MKTRILLCVGLFCLPLQRSYTQGWSFFGPDSEQWRDVSQLDGSFRENRSPRIAATTARGIVSRSNYLWNYVMRNKETCPVWCPQAVYFSPWNDSDAFIRIDRNPDKYNSISFYMVTNTYDDSLWSGHGVAFNAFPHPHSASLGFSHQQETVYILLSELATSTDRGQTWSYGGFRPDLYYDNLFITTNISLDSLLYFGGAPWEFNVFLSTDMGVTWKSILAFSSWFSNAHLLANGNTLVLGTARTWWSGAQSEGDSGIYRSTDQGATWTHVLSTVNVNALARDKLHPQRLYAATSSGIYKSRNEGKTWQIYNNTLPTNNLRDLVKDPYSETLYVATDLGVYKVFDHVVVGVGDESRELPGSFALRQNYPNPFNPTTSIELQIAKPGVVDLKVFDVLGREVAAVVSENLQPGVYTRTWNPGNLAGGVYYYRLRAGTFSDVKKMLLMK